LVDVGGQRSERRKWLNCFDNVKAIIYVVNLAGYCKVLFEDKSVNRMHESLNLFEATLQNPIFASTPVFIFLNKKDLFETLITTKSIKDYCFPEYNGPNDLKSSIDFIAYQYQKRLPPKHSRAIVLLLAARVKKDVQYCFEEVKDIMIDMHQKGIKKAMKELERVEKRNKQDIYLVGGGARGLHDEDGETEAKTAGSGPTERNGMNSNKEPGEAPQAEHGLEGILGGTPYSPGAEGAVSYAQALANQQTTSVQ